MWQNKKIITNRYPVCLRWEIHLVFLLKTTHMKKLILIAIIISIIVSCESSINRSSGLNISSGALERIENFPSNFVSPRNVDIWLPENYSRDQKYAVIYMHDGQMLFDASTTWNNQEWGVDEVVTELIKNETIKECIVVGIWNSGESRHSDYFPQKPFETLSIKLQDSLLNYASKYNVSTLFSVGLQADNYLKFIVDELKPIIDISYSTHRDRENTFIAGSSMGGLISMYAICEYPEIFGGAACMSTHWIGTFTTNENPIPDAFITYLAQNIPDPTQHRFYFDYGTETLDSLYEPYQLLVDSVMKISGYNNENWMTKKFEGENHTEKSWKNRLHIPITYLLEEKK